MKQIFEHFHFHEVVGVHLYVSLVFSVFIIEERKNRSSIQPRRSPALFHLVHLEKTHE